MYVHNIDPVLFQVGSLQIRYYGLAYILGFALLYWYLLKATRTIKGFTKEHAENLTFYIAVGVLIGARILDFVFYNPSVFWTDPIEIFKIWHGGMSFHGGLIGAFIAALIYSKKYRFNLLELGDIAVFPAILSLAIGRIANFINGELYGTITDVAWCVKFKGIDNCRHPYQLYASFSHLVAFGLLSLHKQFHKRRYHGQLFSWFLIYYGAFRFVLDFFREDPRWLGLSTGQYLCIIMAAIGAYMLIKNRTKR